MFPQCSGKTGADLNYNSVNPRTGETAAQHIMNNHVPASAPATNSVMATGKSYYATYPAVWGATLFGHVQNINAATFNGGLPARSRNQIQLTWEMPAHPNIFDPSVIAAYVGYDPHHVGQSMNTLFVSSADCVSVFSSHPGPPTAP